MNRKTRLRSRPTWRDYQARLKRRTGGYRLLGHGRWAAAVIGVLVVGFLSCRFVYNYKGVLESPEKPFESNVSMQESTPPNDAPGFLDKKEIQAWLPTNAIVNMTENSLTVQVSDDSYRIDTSLNPALQENLVKKIRRSKTELMGLVALDPDSGKVLAMVGNDVEKASPNPCLDNSFPAASIFKIVTAAAAIERCGFNDKTEMTFNGGKYTLYKSQLKNQTNRYTNFISFRDSFAQSVNPVFGKIGSQHLGQEPLETYGEAFGFNREIDFEITLPPSILEVEDEAYRLAEIACGFNRTTTLTPLHGALIAAAVLNNGKLPEPTIVEQVVNGNGQRIYQSEPGEMGKAVSSNACELLEILMMRTVSSGTCKKAFQGASRDQVLSRLDIGGKTGSIDNREHSRRIDWFVGFAREKSGPGKIAVAVVVGHGKYMGTRASEFARETFKDYFKEYFATAGVGKNRDG